MHFDLSFASCPDVLSLLDLNFLLDDSPLFPEHYLVRAPKLTHLANWDETATIINSLTASQSSTLTLCIEIEHPEEQTVSSFVRYPRFFHRLIVMTRSDTDLF